MVGALLAFMAVAPARVASQPPAAAGAARQAPSASSANSSFTMLLLDSYDISRPIVQQTIERLRETFNTRVSRRTVLHVESLGQHLAGGPARSQRIAARIADEYAQDPVDLIIATTDSAIAFATRLRSQWGRDIPIVGLLTSAPQLNANVAVPALPNGAWVRIGDMNSAAARNITALIPTLSELLIIGTTTVDVAGAAASMRSIVGRDVRIETFASPTHEDLEQRFASLSDEAAIVYLSVVQDARGRPWQAREYLRTLLTIAPRPVFAWLGTYTGTGIVGGPMLGGAEIGTELGVVAAQILNGTPAASIAPVVVGNTDVVYDWVPLRRFGIPLDRLPAGARIVNRPQPVWESYPRTTSAVAAFIALLLFGMGFLVRNRRLARTTAAAQLAVSRRLLQAQDEERARIARDLHDDLCQEMTVLAIEVGRMPGEPVVRASLGERVHDLIDRTRRIAVGLHASHIGTMPFQHALAAHIASTQARTGLAISFSGDCVHSEPTPQVALALFRGIQESLQNVIRHADATTVTVTLACSDCELRLEVADDGIGFTALPTAHTGLGLASMRERMATIGGTFSVRSVPFGGTVVALSVPRQAVAA